MSYEIEALYHRTFESNRFLSTGNIDFTNNRLPADYRYVPPNRAPTMGPPSSGRGSSPPRRNIMEAYYLNNTALEPIVIWEREDQKLAQYATPWERWWSRLFIHKEAFIPIVNENNTLVGHYGRVLGNRILIKNEDMEGVRYVEDIRDINKVLDLAPLLVGNGDVERSQGYRALYSEYSIYTVQTGVDGDIVYGKFEGFTGNGEALSVDFSPMDLIGGAKLIIQLGYKIAVRLGARKLLTMTGRTLSKKIGSSRLKRIQLGRGYHEDMGIPSEHLVAMVNAAKEVGVIAIFRANKKEAIALIRQGAHGKPKWASFKTSSETGVLTAKTTEQRLISHQNGAFTIDADLVSKKMARRVYEVNGKQVVETVNLKGNWKIEAGQVVGKDGKPYVGDYDLLGVAPMKSPGSNVSLVPDDIITGDWTGPWVKRYSKAVNDKLDKPRVLHGAQDAYGSPPLPDKPDYRGLTDDTAYAVFPDGSTYVMYGRKGQEEFYEAIGRKAHSKAPAPQGDPNFKLHVVK